MKRLAPTLLLIIHLTACQTTGGSKEWGRKAFEGGQVRIGMNVRAALNINLEEARAIASASKDWDRGFSKGQLTLLEEAGVKTGKTAPVIVFLHGCSGMGRSAYDHISALFEMDDYVIIAPDSFANKRPIVCDPSNSSASGLYSDSNHWRLGGLKFALDYIVKSSWADKGNIFLAGHSQGGSIAYGYSGEIKIKGRISDGGGGCRHEYLGNGIEDDEFVIAFHDEHDSWYHKKANSSECRFWAASHPNGTDVYNADGHSHEPLLRKENLSVLRGWLKQHTN